MKQEERLARKAAYESAYAAKKLELEETLAKVPEDHRWKFRIVDEAPCTSTALTFGTMPTLENWADPRPVINVRGHGEGFGLGTVAAGIAGLAIGSMLDGD